MAWSGTRAGVTREGQAIARPGSGNIQLWAQITLEMAADVFNCFLPANGLNPDSTMSAPSGLDEALSLATFKVSFLNVNSNTDGRALLGLIDTRHPVYKYKCLSQNIQAINADYCTGTYPIRMCAVRDRDVSALVVSKNYGNGKGFSRLVDGNPAGTYG